jgi:hypothetical protein
LHADRSTASVAAVREWNSATMFLLEPLIAQRANALLEEDRCPNRVPNHVPKSADLASLEGT